jgi:hypothetical protein
VFEGPGIIGEITRGLSDALASRRADLAALVGSD